MRLPRIDPSVLFLLIAVALAYAGSIGASFQFDDWNVIVRDTRVHSFAAWWHSLPAIRAGLKLSYAVNYELGTGPAGFRILNIAIHATNAVLVFALLRSRSQPAALIAAAVFALAPVQTEAVTYICGRSSSLCALFCLLALFSWQQARRRPLLHVLGVTCYAIALTVKETAIVLPLILVIWQYTRPPEPRPPEPRPPEPWRPAERHALLAYTAVACVALAAAFLSSTYTHLFLTSLQTRSIAENLALQARAWGFLVLELFRLSALTADPTPHDLPGGGATGTLAWPLAWLALAAVAWIRRRKSPEVTFAILWFYLWLLPTNSVLPRLDVANDRQLYLALIGPAWLLACAVTQLGRTVPRVALAVVVTLAVLLGSATAIRNHIYSTEVTFWQAALGRSPGNTRAANNLGIAYALDCNDSQADESFRRAIAADPEDFRAKINLRFLQENRLTRRDSSGCRLVAE
ncbi:MAG TPA: hypothetical protein VGM84_06395 [Steroidobacteraceae bacterium]